MIDASSVFLTRLGHALPSFGLHRPLSGLGMPCDRFQNRNRVARLDLLSSSVDLREAICPSGNAIAEKISQPMKEKMHNHSRIMRCMIHDLKEHFRSPKMNLPNCEVTTRRREKLINRFMVTFDSRIINEPPARSDQHKFS